MFDPGFSFACIFIPEQLTIPTIIHGIKNPTHNHPVVGSFRLSFFILNKLLSSTTSFPLFLPSEAMEMVPLALSCSWGEGKVWEKRAMEGEGRG